MTRLPPGLGQEKIAKEQIDDELEHGTPPWRD
jgi:hypothetical protein